MTYDVVVIGAGMSGLAAGIRLALAGKSVRVFERHTVPGGLNSYYRGRGLDWEVGLHALTNFAPPDDRRAPLNRILRQLRIPREALELCEQDHSLIRFPELTLRFSNGGQEFETQVAEAFPGEIDNYRRLVQRIREQAATSLTIQPESTRAVLEQHIGDPLLRTMILCPAMLYGSPEEDDVEFNHFCVLFRGIFLEGFSRPRNGIRSLIRLLVRKFRQEGGELTVGCGIRRILTRRDRVTGVETEHGEICETSRVLSSAGGRETLLLTDDASRADAFPPGPISFTESVVVLNRAPRDFGCTPAVVFESLRSEFTYRCPEGLVEQASRILSFPTNFPGAEPGLPSPLARVSHVANPTRWSHLTPDEYRAAKQRVSAYDVELLERDLPGLAPHVLQTDLFTPRTVERFTGHLNGAVYGSPVKHRDGLTSVENLFLCGTDQGFLGITGALMSGISIANAYLVTA